jgi:4-aminobutyrate aminotransferase-like enzyme
MAHAFTGKRDVVVLEHGYHGNTRTCIDISDYKFSKARGQGQMDYILRAEIPDTFRGKFREDDGTAGQQYAGGLAAQLKEHEGGIAAFIAEPVLGCGGQVPLARDYLKKVYPRIRKRGGICISDEVQVGFGRLGDVFWGFEAQDVIPDIVILGKPMGNGHPIGAVVCTGEIAESFSQGVEFFSSFGGNPVSCAIGLAVLDVIEEEGLQRNAMETGAYYFSLLRELQAEFENIGDVRGSGLFLGIDLVRDEDHTPNTELAAHLKNELRERNILVSTDGPYDNVIKTKPPMCFNRLNAERVVETIREILLRSTHLS